MMIGNIKFELKTEHEAYILMHLFATHKFRINNTISYLSTIVNDTLKECIASFPDLENRFEEFRIDAINRFKFQMTYGGTWNWFQSLPNEDEKREIIREFFLPLPQKFIKDLTKEGIMNAYREK